MFCCVSLPVWRSFKAVLLVPVVHSAVILLKLIVKQLLMFCFRLSVVMPALEETDDSISDEDISATLSQHVEASLCIHYSLVFFVGRCLLNALKCRLSVGNMYFSYPKTAKVSGRQRRVEVGKKCGQCWAVMV